MRAFVSMCVHAHTCIHRVLLSSKCPIFYLWGLIAHLLKKMILSSFSKKNEPGVKQEVAGAGSAPSASALTLVLGQALGSWQVTGCVKTPPSRHDRATSNEPHCRPLHPEPGLQECESPSLHSKASSAGDGKRTSTQYGT